MTAPFRIDQESDQRFQSLVAPKHWAELPLAVQRRFTKHLGPGQSVTYVGKITAFRRNRFGRWLSHAFRLIGAPLPLCPKLGMATVVSVTEDAARHGQNWTRLYANEDGFPQVIHSAKRFEGPTGLIERIGKGISMRLKVEVNAGILTFKNAGFTLSLGSLSMPIPALLCPGDVKICHRDLGHGGFEFSLKVVHPILGELIYQAAQYQEAKP